MDALETVVRLLGGQAATARALERETGNPVRQATVWWWLNKSRTVPAEYVLPLERLSAAKVSRHDLRPDLYPREEHSAT